MMSSIKRLTAVLVGLCVLVVVLGSWFAREAHAVGVLYADPGWLHAFDGDSAYYHDPDGPPVGGYNGNDSTNMPGGETGWAALIDVTGGGCGDYGCTSEAIWQYQTSQWEGSAPGDPLGGPPNPFNTQIPPVPPPAPGGVGTFTEGSTSFLRMQDPGLPNPYGWAEKGAYLPGTVDVRQEGNNKKIDFRHEMNRDAGFVDTDSIIDDGVTVSFRARIATAATGPLDMHFSEEGPDPVAWPTDGYGYPVSNNARGIVTISQGLQGSSTTPPGRLAFGLLDDNTVTYSQATDSEPLVVTKRGLIMNNQAGASGPDTNQGTDATANVVEIDNAELTDWHEFWITVEALPAPVDGNTHEVNVYMDGSLDPETFQVVLGPEIDNDGSFLGMGVSSGSRQGAVDIDFVAYAQDVFVPTLNPMGLPGDHNEDGKVDAADYALWRSDPATYGGAQGYTDWVDNFGAMSGSASGLGVGSAAVPEPSSVILFSLATLVVGVLGRRRRTFRQ